MSFTDVLMVEITNVSVKLSVVNTCFVPCYVVDCFGVDRDRERERDRENAITLPHSQQQRRKPLG